MVVCTGSRMSWSDEGFEATGSLCALGTGVVAGTGLPSGAHSQLMSFRALLKCHLLNEATGHLSKAETPFPALLVSFVILDCLFFILFFIIFYIQYYFLLVLGIQFSS